ncbi:MAG: M23 family metallopeptidase [Opitutae bacterium]|nr:M23 family metallopeptidase [Opitutae bacterium]
MRRRLLSVFLLLLGTASGWAARIEFVWPTPNKAWERGRPIEDFIQPTASGDPESGTFGGVRSGGRQFHEGLDIKPVKRDRSGEPADPIFAAMRGVVRYVSLSPGGSNYGRYIVIEHPDLQPAVYTLYAHLARVEPGIRAGAAVEAGQTIALMGRSSSGQAIPKERGHLHFEIGLRATDNFDTWYRTRKFGSPNEHGVYNGMNLMGLDPLDFLRQWRAGKVDDFQQYLSRMRAVVRVRVATSRVPDFISRYPALLRKPMPAGLVAGWEVECNSTGLPFAWTPLGPNELVGARPGSVQIVSVEAALVRANRSKSLVYSRRSGYEPGSDLAMMLQQVFGVR